MELHEYTGQIYQIMDTLKIERTGVLTGVPNPRDIESVIPAIAHPSEHTHETTDQFVQTIIVALLSISELVEHNEGFSEADQHRAEQLHTIAHALELGRQVGIRESERMNQ